MAVHLPIVNGAGRFTHTVFACVTAGYRIELAIVGPMGAEQVQPLLGRFVADTSRMVPLVAVWAHGSLALGDFQPGRSDLDLVAVVSERLSDRHQADLQRVHGTLIADVPLAAGLHCAYMARGELADPGQAHPTWAHREMFDRIVSPVTRRELTQGGLNLHGPAPARLVPAVSDQELASYIRGDLRDYWYPHTELHELWLRDIWVDLGLLTLARASVTLCEGRLISKREALDVLGRLDAPPEVVRDIYRRRYEDKQPVSEEWRTQRGRLARTFVRTGIERVLALPHAR